MQYDITAFVFCYALRFCYMCLKSTETEWERWLPRKPYDAVWHTCEWICVLCAAMGVHDAPGVSWRHDVSIGLATRGLTSRSRPKSDCEHVNSTLLITRRATDGLFLIGREGRAPIIHWTLVRMLHDHQHTRQQHIVPPDLRKLHYDLSRPASIYFALQHLLRNIR